MVDSSPHSARDRVLIRRATLADIPAVTQIHAQAFPGFFLTLLGPGFLGELYRGFLGDRGGICLAATRAGAVIGFTFGTLNPRAFFRSLLFRRWHFFVIHAGAALARHPLNVARRLLGALRYRGEEPEQEHGGALLSSVAVLPEHRGGGAGSMLVEEFCRMAAAGGARYVYLITDSERNDTVNRFYVRAGFSIESRLVKHRGRSMSRYVRRVTP